MPLIAVPETVPVACDDDVTVGSDDDDGEDEVEEGVEEREEDDRGEADSRWAEDELKGELECCCC